MRFKPYVNNPIIPRTPGTWHGICVANPDVLFLRGKYHLYFRGQGEDGHDQIGVGYSTPEAFDGVHWDMCPENPVIRVGGNPSDFDSAHVLDPAAVEVDARLPGVALPRRYGPGSARGSAPFGRPPAGIDGRVHLYYTGHSLDRSVLSSVGLATSADGTHFEKHPAGPVVIDGIGPEVVLHRGVVHLFYQRAIENGQRWQVYCRRSEDGVHFHEHEECVVFGPSRVEGAFDGHSVATVRIWQEGGWFYMTYAGCDRYIDYPCAIGLARSRDLLNWERYPDNPVMWRGEPGTWDEGALWFPTVCRVGNTYYLWYEGGGAGLGLETPEAREASRLSREENYGGFGITAFSQIGLATYTGETPRW